MRTITLAAVVVAICCLAACSEQGSAIPLNTNSSTFRLVGASATAPTGAALPAEQQALADRLLGGRWSTLGLRYQRSGGSRLTLTDGSFESSQAPAPATSWAYQYPQSDAATGTLALQGADAVWTTQFADAGSGFTDVTVTGRLAAADVATRVVDLMARRLENANRVDRAADPLPIRWTIAGQYQGAPFTAEVEQDYYVEGYSYGSEGVE